MNSNSEESITRPCWFVGASYNRSEDQTERFLRDGIWENDFDDDHQFVAMTKTMQAGDRIAIKATYVRRNGLPFNNNGRPVSVMAIKAIGSIVENVGDGHTVRVDWTQVDPVREWYLYTYIKTIWKVIPGSDRWLSDALIGFAFDNVKQDIEGFLEIDYWGKRYKGYAWTDFYEAFANKLLEFKDRRTDLINRLHAVATKEDSMYLVQDRFSDGTTGLLRDICPFTIMGMFNRQINDANRIKVATELANQLDVPEPVPDKLGGIPVVDNRSSWFFNFEKDRKPDDIDVLWDVFSSAMSFADSEDSDTLSAFISTYDSAIKQPNVGWKLSFGLYWIRPWSFPSLDSPAQEYIKNGLGIEIGLNGPKNRCNANDYLNVRDSLNSRFLDEDCPVSSFPQLGYEVWKRKVDPPPPPPPPLPEYTLDNIVKDGCFIARSKLETMIESLSKKKNLILQGPPGTGKTWLAKKLAFALIGRQDDSKIRPVQFHPNLSYEDFVRGWRPSGDGKLTLVDGPFVVLRNEAENDPDSKYVMVIEEINRGNPAQIFGEMLTLLEADKRTPSEAIELVYKWDLNDKFFIPDNVYVIGTMNIADRSLALVDLALRRRFAFIDLEPSLGEPWRKWVHSQFGIDMDTLRDIEDRIIDLNQTIKEDATLGPQYRVGHSYVTPQQESPIGDGRNWFRQIVDTEIGRLLDEYWYDDLAKSHTEKAKLLEGF